MSWFNCVRDEISVGTCQKVGFGTLNHAKYNYGMLKREFPMFEERYWFVRHPVARFKSLYKYINSDLVRLERLALLKGMPPAKLIDFIEKNWNRDTHWRGQTAHLNFYTANVVPLERMGEMIDAERQNVTNSGDLVLHEDLENRILKLYQEDHKMWLAAKENEIELPKLRKVR